MFKTIAIILLWISGLFSTLINILEYNSKDNPIPECVKDVYDEETYLKWKKYHSEMTLNDIIFESLSLVIYTIILETNLLSLISNNISDSIFIQVVCVLGTFTFIDAIVACFRSYIVNFKIEQKYGFNKMTMKTFISDMIKSLIISFVVSIGLVYLFGIIHNALHDYVILLFTGIAICLVLLLMFLYPKFSKIFNKFTPLEDGGLKEKLVNLLESHDYHVKALNVMDASKRTSKSNAYFSGFGKTKTIVLYDTLIESMSEDEIVAVFAHELGHGLHKDTIKNSFLSFFNVAIIVAIAWIMVKVPAIYTAFGFKGLNYAFSFIILNTSVLPLISPLISLLSSFASRKAEYAADKQAVEEGYGKELISALKKLGKENFANLSPNKIVVALTYTHPTLAQRIERINKEMNVD